VQSHKISKKSLNRSIIVHIFILRSDVILESQYRGTGRAGTVVVLGLTTEMTRVAG